MRRGLALWLACLIGTALAHGGDGYDPLRVDAGTINPLDFVVRDAPRDREIPLRVYLPMSAAPAPVVLFSHGLGGSRQNNPYLGKHWALRGYVVVFMQHPGSDESVWRDKPLGQRMTALRQAASAENFQKRVRDVPVLLDQLQAWNQEAGHPLGGRMNLKRVGMSGHSFGAVTTQAVSGQSFPLGRDFTDARITAACMMSPSSPRVGDPKSAFGKVKIPWLLLTGTKDVAPIGDADVKSRLAVFPALPPVGKYELVLENAEHSAFGDSPLPGDKERRNPNHHRAILAVTTAFWDAYLRDDPAARPWLDSDAVRGVLEKGDAWQRK